MNSTETRSTPVESNTAPTTTTYELLTPMGGEDDELAGVMATTTSLRIAKRWAADNGPDTIRKAQQS